MVSESTIVVRYAETDQMGVAHHAVYPVWYEVARTDFIKKLGVTYSGMERMGVMTPLISLHCAYRGATRYEDELTVRVWMSRLTPARVEFSYEITRSGDAKPCNMGTTEHPFVDAHTFQPMNLKKRFPDLYARLAEAASDGDGAR